jgi:hypothetical protein
MNGHATVEDGYCFTEWVYKHIDQETRWGLRLSQGTRNLLKTTCQELWPEQLTAAGEGEIPFRAALPAAIHCASHGPWQVFFSRF